MPQSRKPTKRTKKPERIKARVPLSSLEVRTPRGRRRTSLLVIVTGLLVSHGYHSDIVGDTWTGFHNEIRSVTSGVPSETNWSP
jgi:hypothetical protein